MVRKLENFLLYIIVPVVLMHTIAISHIMFPLHILMISVIGTLAIMTMIYKYYDKNKD